MDQRCHSTNLSFSGNDTYLVNQFDRSALDVVLVSIWSVVMVTGISGNALLLLAVAASRSLQTMSNILVANVIAADVVVCSLLPLQAVSVLLQETSAEEEEEQEEMEMRAGDGGACIGGVLPRHTCVSIATLLVVWLWSRAVSLGILSHQRLLQHMEIRSRWATTHKRKGLSLMAFLTVLLSTVSVVLIAYFGGNVHLGFSDETGLCIHWVEGGPALLMVRVSTPLMWVALVLWSARNYHAIRLFEKSRKVEHKRARRKKRRPNPLKDPSAFTTPTSPFEEVEQASPVIHRKGKAPRKKRRDHKPKDKSRPGKTSNARLGPTGKKADQSPGTLRVPDTPRKPDNPQKPSIPRKALKPPTIRTQGSHRIERADDTRQCESDRVFGIQRNPLGTLAAEEDLKMAFSGQAMKGRTHAISTICWDEEDLPDHKGITNMEGDNDIDGQEENTTMKKRKGLFNASRGRHVSHGNGHGDGDTNDNTGNEHCADTLKDDDSDAEMTGEEADEESYISGCCSCLSVNEDQPRECRNYGATNDINDSSTCRGKQRDQDGEQHGDDKDASDEDASRCCLRLSYKPNRHQVQESTQIRVLQSIIELQPVRSSKISMRRRVPGMMPSSFSRRQRVRELRETQVSVTKSLAALTVIYLLLILPKLLCSLFPEQCLRRRPRMFKVAETLYYATSCVSPVILIVFHRTFNQVLGHVLRRRWGSIPARSGWVNRLINTKSEGVPERV